MTGVPEDEIRVELDPARLRALGLTPDDVVQGDPGRQRERARRHHPAGAVPVLGAGPDRAAALDEFADIPVGARPAPARAVRLRDIGDGLARLRRSAHPHPAGWRRPASGSWSTRTPAPTPSPSPRDLEAVGDASWAGSSPSCRSGWWRRRRGSSTTRSPTWPRRSSRRRPLAAGDPALPGRLAERARHRADRAAVGAGVAHRAAAARASPSTCSRSAAWRSAWACWWTTPSSWPRPAGGYREAGMGRLEAARPAAEEVPDR